MKRNCAECDSAFYRTIDEMNSDPRIRRMGQFRQHRCTTTLYHCNHVAKCSYRIARALRMNIDEESLARGTMLHDYYLYSTKDMDYSAYYHGTQHPAFALRNASKEYNLNETERDIIRNHMWPLTLRHIPHTKECWLVSVADKVCAIEEAAGIRPKYAEVIRSRI